MPWTRFLARLPIPLWTRRPVPPKMARANRNIIIHPRLLTARRSPQTKKMIRERIKYVVRGLDPLRAGSTFPGGALTIVQGHRTAAKLHPRRIAIFGGSFDPIHNGHLAAARAADRRFNFDEIHFVPASRPPHKLKRRSAARAAARWPLWMGSKEPPKIAMRRGWCFAAVRCACAVVNETPKKVLTAHTESRPRTIYAILSRIFFFVRGHPRAVNRRG